MCHRMAMSALEDSLTCEYVPWAYHIAIVIGWKIHIESKCGITRQGEGDAHVPVSYQVGQERC
jgi:hypothetical protein